MLNYMIQVVHTSKNYGMPNEANIKYIKMKN